MFPLLETIRIENGGIKNQSYHEERIDRSLKILFGKRELPNLEKLIFNLNDYHTGIYKCRILYSNTDYQVTFEPYTKRSITRLKLVESTDIKYDLKYSERSFFENFAMKDDSSEILFTQKGFLTDTRYTNIALLKEGLWVTPEKPLLMGTQRANLIDLEYIVPGEIRIDNIGEFSKIRLINAMMPWEDCIELETEQIEKI